MKKLFVIATIVGFSFGVANAQTTPANNVSGTPTNLSTVGSPIKKQSTATVRPAVGAPTTVPAKASPAIKKAGVPAKTEGTKMAGKVGSPANKANKATTPGKMQSNPVPMAK